MPLIRAIISSQSAEAYAFMFTSVFRYLTTAYDVSLKWKHIHGHGIRGVTLDQDIACIKGISF